MAQFKKITGSSGNDHYRLSMGKREAASLVALLDHSDFGGHYLDRIATAINDSEASFELPSAGVTAPEYAVSERGVIEVE